MNPLELFDQATRTVTDERGAVYGHPADDFGRIVRMAAEIAACSDPELKHALYMILVKVARLAHSPDHIDSWIDIFGYARCAAMILERREASHAG